MISAPVATLVCLATLFTEREIELAYIDILANLNIRLDGVKRMTQIQNTS